MSIKGQTHQKRAREFALKERRERKKAKKEARGLPVDPAAEGVTEDGEPILEAEPVPVAEWVQ